VNEIPQLKRIRFMTSHPKDFSDELIAAVRDLPKVCKAVHLPLQSGSTRVLADMNRHYTKEDYFLLAEKLYAAVPEIALSTDIIVGYPGETDRDFADTLDIVRKVRFAGAFTFIYSKRGGTPAASRTDLVPRKTANERFDRLTAELYPIMTEKNSQKIGRVIDVMVEEEGAAYKGRADDHTLVHFTSARKLQPGEIVPVRIEAAKTFYVSGVSA
jgi:tRNA-2-methylthio-N6-dimethylallyladenosine synthase